jgi:hypothetical protein
MCFQGDAEIEIDIDSMDNGTLRELQVSITATTVTAILATICIITATATAHITAATAIIATDIDTQAVLLPALLNYPLLCSFVLLYIACSLLVSQVYIDSCLQRSRSRNGTSSSRNRRSSPVNSYASDSVSLCSLPISISCFQYRRCLCATFFVACCCRLSISVL